METKLDAMETIATEQSKQPEFDAVIQYFFQDCSKKLDEHNDRHERLVKLSRDITIESKRIIFLLHRIQDDETKSKLTSEADAKLQWVISNPWNRVAKELLGHDHHHYLRAYSPGKHQ